MRTHRVDNPMKSCRSCGVVLSDDHYYVVLHTQPGDDPNISVNDYLCPPCKETHDPVDRTE